MQHLLRFKDTAQARFQSRPDAVQIVLKCKMTVDSLDDPLPDLDAYAASALAWWDRMAASRPARTSEERFAELAIERLRKQSVWGKILRGDTQ